MTRDQKRARHFRRKQHSEASQGKTAIVTYPNGQKVEVACGPKPNPVSHHKGDQYRHGHRLDARGVALKALSELGIHDPDLSTIREFQRLVKRCGGSISTAKHQLEENLKKVSRDIARGDRTFVIDAPEGVDVKALEGAVEIANETLADRARPSQKEWDDLTATAKAKKKSISKFAQKAGYELVNDQADPKLRTSWVTK